MTDVQANPATAAGTFDLGGTTRVHRLGFGAMQITGDRVWGPPDDPDEAVRVLRRAVDLGVDLIDTADSYGPFVSEELIAEALHPYPEHLVVATKAGFVRAGPGEWFAVGYPQYLRQQCEMSMRRLRLDCIPLFQLHRIDSKVPLEDQLGELGDLQKEGKVLHVGLSEVTIEEIEKARAVTEIASVQNRFNLTYREWSGVVDYCEREQLGFIPWFPIATGELAKPGGALDAMTGRLGASPVQLALAWLLKRSPVILPIPGTSSVAHLEENVAAALVELGDADFEALSAAT